MPQMARAKQELPVWVSIKQHHKPSTVSHPIFIYSGILYTDIGIIVVVLSTIIKEVINVPQMSACE